MMFEFHNKFKYNFKCKRNKMMNISRKSKAKPLTNKINKIPNIKEKFKKLWKKLKRNNNCPKNRLQIVVRSIKTMNYSKTSVSKK